MNLKSRINGCAAYIAAAILIMSPISTISANDSDDFGIWTSLKASKKLTDKLEFEIEGELRTIEGVQEIDRRSIGVSLGYDLLDWLKVDGGYIYISSFNQEEKKIKELVDEDWQVYNYNIDHSYWEKRDRFFVSLIADWKIGRVKFSLRERLQYQYTHSALTYEDKYRFINGGMNDDGTTNPPTPENPDNQPDGGSELKSAKHNTLLRSRLTAKWDIRKCKIAPFASVELFTRLDEWTGHDKLRYRLGADYKIDKDNDISLYYMYQDNHSSNNPAGHAVCVGYSFEF